MLSQSRFSMQPVFGMCCATAMIFIVGCSEEKESLSPEALNYFNSLEDATAKSATGKAVQVPEPKKPGKVRAPLIAETSTPKPKRKKEWYSGGTLYKKSALDWQEASAENKLATCADFVAGMWKNCDLKPEIADNLSGTDSVRPSGSVDRCSDLVRTSCGRHLRQFNDLEVPALVPPFSAPLRPVNGFALPHRMSDNFPYVRKLSG